MSDLTDAIAHDKAILDPVREHLAGRHDGPTTVPGCLMCDHILLGNEQDVLRQLAHRDVQEATGQGPWRALLADECGDVVTDPEEIAELLADEEGRGSISIRRGSALPDEHGRLAGTYQQIDVFGEVDLEDINIEDADEVWRLVQAAAAGMNRAEREARRG